jgi:hypothetical protein
MPTLAEINALEDRVLQHITIIPDGGILRPVDWNLASGKMAGGEASIFRMKRRCLPGTGFGAIPKAEGWEQVLTRADAVWDLAHQTFPKGRISRDGQFPSFGDHVY